MSIGEKEIIRMTMKVGVFPLEGGKEKRRES